MLKSKLYEYCLSFKNGSISKEKNFERHFPDEYKEITSWVFPPDFIFVQKLYHYLNDDIGLYLGLCQNCGKRTKFRNLHIGYAIFCCTKCSSSSSIVKEKVKKTCMDRYGVENIMDLEETRERIKKTNMERYGDEIPQHCDVVRERAKQTCMKHYGVEYPMQSEKVKEKSRKTSLVTYGVENPMQSEEVRKKARETNLKVYGVEYGLQSVDVKNKGKLTSLNRYGVDHPMKSDVVKEKVAKTLYENYGVEHALQSVAIKNNMKTNLLKKYGVDHNSKIQDVKDKKIKTSREHYGVDYPTQCDDVKKQISKTCLEKYGVNWACMREEARFSSSNDSKPNLLFRDLLDANNIAYDREFPVEKYVYDFKVGDILLEINPTITHNSYLGVYGCPPTDKLYHKNKSLVAVRNGYRCVHVWDWDDITKIIKFLCPKQKIYARKCSLNIIDNNECDCFLNMFHFQKTCTGKIVCFGLYFNDVLVEVMAFGKPRYNKHYEWELLRLCTHNEYYVIGGSEKLFSYFIKNYSPKSIISYNDNSKFDGNVYKKLGFAKNKESSPSVHWYNLKTNRHITDNMLRKYGYDILFNENYGKYTSNEELMLNNGFLPVYDCGQETYTINF